MPERWRQSTHIVQFKHRAPNYFSTNNLCAASFYSQNLVEDVMVSSKH